MDFNEFLKKQVRGDSGDLTPDEAKTLAVKGLTSAFGGGAKPKDFEDSSKQEPTLAEPTIDPINLIGSAAASAITPGIVGAGEKAVEAIRPIASRFAADEAGVLKLPGLSGMMSKLPDSTKTTAARQIADDASRSAVIGDLKQPSVAMATQTLNTNVSRDQQAAVNKILASQARMAKIRQMMGK